MAAVRILFFGAIGDLFGPERTVGTEGTSVGALRQMLSNEHQAIASPRIRAAVRQQPAGEETSVQPGDEVAFFSPVSGG
jgi:sulfur-carrier protein